MRAEVRTGSGARRPVLALDIGGTKLAAGVVGPDGAVRSFLVAPSNSEEGAEPTLERLFTLGRDAVAASGVAWDEISDVGIGCGGPLDAERGVLIAPPHLRGWRDVHVSELAERAYGRTATLENDATAAAAGEHRWGAGRGTLNMVYLTVSTGVGGGAVIDGRLYRGAGGNGGELGHVTVDWHGRPCRSCGRAGCLEAYVSGTSIVERAREAGLRYDTAEEVAAAARDGDPGAARVWDETIEALACGVTSIVNLFEPELVVIGGGVSRSGERLFGPLRAAVRDGAMSPAGEARIVPAALGERVGVAGAAAIVYEATPAGGDERG
ncbi:MAG TPA: ROK family protein [Gaiellaceae bacterium]|jgi:glucokinase|nr:ROK family protein [Gaiellaceae bacterium]